MSAAEQEKVFIDSDVLLYLLSGDAAKADRVEALLRLRRTISVQVLNEVTGVWVRKLGTAWREVGKFLDLVRSLCHPSVAPLAVEVHDMGRCIAERYGLAFYDACIVAAASLEGCDSLYTEDMHHGLIVDDGLTLRNPFA